MESIHNVPELISNTTYTLTLTYKMSGYDHVFLTSTQTVVSDINGNAEIQIPIVHPSTMNVDYSFDDGASMPITGTFTIVGTSDINICCNLPILHANETDPEITYPELNLIPVDVPSINTNCITGGLGTIINSIDNGILQTNGLDPTAIQEQLNAHMAALQTQVDLYRENTQTQVSERTAEINTALSQACTMMAAIHEQLKTGTGAISN